MPQQSRFSILLNELKRRRVFRVAAVYGGVAFVLTEIVGNTFSYLGIPDWFGTAIIVLLIAGFPLAVGLAWVFDITPEGIVRTKRTLRQAQGGGELLEAQGDGVGGMIQPGSSKPLTSNRALMVIAVLAVAFGVWSRWGAGRDNSAATGAVLVNSVAVLPFSVRGGSDYDYLGAGMVDLLSTKLDGAGSWRSVDPRAVLSLVVREGGGAPDPERGRGIAQHLGAGLYVLGNIVVVGGRLRLDASLYNPNRGLEAVARGTAEGEAVQIFDLVDEVAAQILIGQRGGPGARVQHIAEVTTSSLPALRAYLEGESAFRAGHFEPAVEAFQRAVALDSQFALAYYRLSNAARWLLRKKLPHEAAELASRHSGRLSDHNQRLLKAFLASLGGASVEAEREYRSLVGTYPDDIEAWFELGELLFHNNPLRGRSFAESRHAFERVLFYEPDHTTSLIHLARIAASQGQLAEMDSLVNQYIALNPEGDRKLEMLALQAFSHGDLEGQERVVAQLRWANDLTLALAFWDVAMYANNLPAAESLARLAIASSRSSEVRAIGHAWLAHLQLANGRWKSAKVDLAAIESFDHVMSLEYHVLLSTLPFVPTQRAELSTLRVALGNLDPAAMPHSDNPSIIFNAHNDLHSLLQIYLMGLLSVRLGDFDGASQYAEQINRLDIPSGHATLAANLAQSVRSQIDRLQGRTAAALENLEQTRMDTWYGQTMASPFYSQAYERFSRAELLYELGQDQEALGWYSHIAETSPFELVYLPISHLRRGEIYERLGKPKKAVEHYARFVELWKDCDQELQPMVDGAKVRLAKLNELDGQSTNSAS